MPVRGLGRAARVCFAALGCLVLANCSASEVFSSKESRISQRVPADAEIPKGGGSYKVGRPYNVRGKTYYPSADTNYRAEGIASWYGPDFHGRLTANGEIYNMNGYSAAHTTLPLPSYARVTNLSNSKSMIVRVNNRGPFVHDRLIDLSVGTAKALGFYGNGIARVRVEYVGRAPIEGSDDRMLLATLREGSPAPAPSKVMIASAKPFLPNLAGTSGHGRDTAAPLPAERPFALGAAANRAGSKSASAETKPAKRIAAKPAGKLPEGSRTEASVRSTPPSASSSSTASSPTSSFAPSREGPGGLMSGRGLY
jgi:peptidoglycan lytic transglycosylase